MFRIRMYFIQYRSGLELVRSVEVVCYFTEPSDETFWFWYGLKLNQFLS